MFGKGLLKGLGVTGKETFRKRLTEKYPEEMPVLSKRWRGNFQLDVDACIACGLCAKACPNQVIEMTVDKNEEGKKVLTEYWLNQQYCLFCGLCVEACPKHCLRFTKDFETAVYSRFDIPRELVANPNLDAPSSEYAQPAPKPAAPKPAPKAETAEAASEAPKAEPAAAPKAETAEPAAAPKVDAPQAETADSAQATEQAPVAEAPEAPTAEEKKEVVE